MTYFELSAESMERYGSLIEDLKKSTDCYVKFQFLNTIFGVLEKSRAYPGTGPEWAKELISLYRELGRDVLPEIIVCLEEAEREKINLLEQELVEIKSRLSSLENL